MNLAGDIRTQDAQFNVSGDPACLADSKVTDKTTCKKVLTIKGKAHVFITGMGCAILDVDKASSNPSYQVTPSTSTSTTRPIYDVVAYLACTTCALKKIGDAPNGTVCKSAIIKTPEYREVTVGTKTGMSICKLVPGKQLLVPVEWTPFGDYMTRFPNITESDAVCTAKVGVVPDFTIQGLTNPAVGNIGIQAVPANATGVSFKFFIDGTQVNEEFSAPYSLGGDDGKIPIFNSRTLTDGNHQLRVVMTHSAGSTEKTVTLTVKNNP